MVGAVAAALAGAGGAPARAEAYLGLQGLLVDGYHDEPGYQQRGIAPAGLIEAGYRHEALAVHIEGIPVISTSASPTSAKFGTTAPAIGIVDASLGLALDRRGRLIAGVGGTLINQRTPLPAMQRIVASRLIGVRYELTVHQPLPSPAHFVELRAGATPWLYGRDLFLFDDPTIAPIDRQERASETDLHLAYGVTARSATYLFGIQLINYAADFVDEPRGAADRNDAVGLLVEARWRLGR